MYRQSPSTTDALCLADHRTFPTRIFCHIMRSTYGKIKRFSVVSRMVTFPDETISYDYTPNMNNTVYKFIPRRKARAFNPAGLRQMPNALPPQF